MDNPYQSKKYNRIHWKELSLSLFLRSAHQIPVSSSYAVAMGQLSGIVGLVQSLRLSFETICSLTFTIA